MTYDKMYDVLSFLKKQNITLKPEYLRKIAQSNCFLDLYYPILELDEELLKIYFDNDMEPLMADFLLTAKRKKIDTEKIKYYLKIVEKESNKEKKLCILETCTVSIRKDSPKILEDVLSQNQGNLAAVKMNILLNLHMISSPILENALAMYYILKQPTIDDMKAMLECASASYILENDFALKLISDAKKEAKMLLKQALEKVTIRNNSFALYMISKQPSIKRMKIMFRACEEEFGLEKPENLLLLDSMKTEEDMELYCGILAYTQVREKSLLKNKLVDNIPTVVSQNLKNVDEALTTINDFIESEKLEQIAEQTTVAASNAVLEAYKNITKTNASNLRKNNVQDENIEFLMNLKALEEKKIEEEQALTKSMEDCFVTGEYETFLDSYVANQSLQRRLKYQDIHLEQCKKQEEEAN